MKEKNIQGKNKLARLEVQLEAFREQEKMLEKERHHCEMYIAELIELINQKSLGRNKAKVLEREFQRRLKELELRREELDLEKAKLKVQVWGIQQKAAHEALTGQFTLKTEEINQIRQKKYESFQSSQTKVHPDLLNPFLISVASFWKQSTPVTWKETQHALNDIVESYRDELIPGCGRQIAACVTCWRLASFFLFYFFPKLLKTAVSQQWAKL